jgi:ferrous iron transport protein B
LPVYTLLIAAFVPTVTVFWIFSLQGVLLMAIYSLGAITAVIVAYIFKKTIPQKEKISLMMELPPYRMPLLRSVWWQIYDRSKSFIITAGSIIMAMSVILWFLATYPRPDNTEQLSSSQQIETSYAGLLGKSIEPVIKPLGYDWKIGIGLITSFAAREVIISTLSTLYNVSSDEGSTSLITAMRNDRHPDGKRVFTPLVALSLMVFFAYAAQCMATFAIVKKETNSWRWPVFMVVYLTVLAYVSALAVYQVGILMGFA